ncbi:MAG: PH domain-containing protein [Flavobacteriaceae bacterium]|nr:PH domain-containing protein [Flavobacteriaceae bacterium]
MKTQLKKNEKVVLTIRKHWFVLLNPILWTLILFIVAAAASNSEFGNFLFIGVGLTIVWLIYRVLDRNTNLWAVTNLRVIDEYGVFSNNSKETPLDKINNVSYRQPLLGRMFNYGHVQIQSAAESGSTMHKMVERPKDLKDTITQYQERYKQEQIKEQAQSLANAVGGQKPSVGINVSEELTKLHGLKEKGIITEEDFQKGKDKILDN